MENYLKQLIDNFSFELLILFIIFDVILGILRAIKEKKLNSSIGIDGMIRKCGMIISLVFLLFIDKLINLNLLGFIPESLNSILEFKKIGIGELFVVLYIVFESLSILKNMYKCKLPIPKSLQKLLEKILMEFTEEVQ